MKKVKYILFGFFTSVLFLITAQASNVSASISGPSSAVVGETVKFTVTLRASGSTLGICTFDVALSNFNVPGSSIQLDDKCYGKSSYSYSFSYKVKSSGNATITVKNSNIVLDDESRAYPTASKTIKVITKEEQLASLSDNNYLKSLGVEGYSLTPEFNKDTLEYTVNVEESVEKIVVTAEKEDGRASITGIGEINLNELNGKINIDVISQRGNKKTYMINVNIIDSNPIKKNLNGESLTIVKKASMLVAPDGFEQTTIKMSDQDIPALYNKKANITLVGLKNDKGVVSLYIYDAKKDEFNEYKEVKSNYISIVETNIKNAPEGYFATTIKIGEKNVTAYKMNSKSKFSLIYGINLETGEKNWYMYDEVEETLQRYNDEEINNLNKKLKDSKFLIEILIGGCVLLFILFLIMATKKDKRNRKKQSNENNVEGKKVEVKETKGKGDDTVEIKQDEIKKLAKKSKSNSKKLKEWDK